MNHQSNFTGFFFPVPCTSRIKARCLQVYFHLVQARTPPTHRVRLMWTVPDLFGISLMSPLLARKPLPHFFLMSATAFGFQDPLPRRLVSLPSSGYYHVFLHQSFKMVPVPRFSQPPQFTRTTNPLLRSQYCRLNTRFPPF